MHPPPAVGQGPGQARGTAGMRACHPDAQGGDASHRNDPSAFHHRRTGHTGAAAAPGADVSLPQLLLVAVDRILTQGFKGLLQFLFCTNAAGCLGFFRHLPGSGHGPFPRRGRQDQRRVRPQADLLNLKPAGSFAEVLLNRQADSRLPFQSCPYACPHLV